MKFYTYTQLSIYMTTSTGDTFTKRAYCLPRRGAAAGLCYVWGARCTFYQIQKT